MIEVLVAVAILLLATVGPMTIASRSMQHAQFAREQNTAFFLAQEAIEAVTALRNERALEHIDQYPSGPSAWSWTGDSALDDCFVSSNSDGCGIDWRDNSLTNNIVDCSVAGACRLYLNAADTRARYSHVSGGSPTQYARVVKLESIAADVVSVEVTVSWQATGAQTNKDVRLQVYLHDIYDLD